PCEHDRRAAVLSRHASKSGAEDGRNTAVGADAVILWMFTRTREELYPAMARGAVLSQLGHVKVGEGVVGVVAQQGTNVLLHEEAQRLSLTDGLTGIYNRRYLQMQARQVLAAAVRFNRPFSILMMDLDHFKQVNDNFGHNRGDAILIEFSKRVSDTLREVDTFARYGGEEFVCLLSEPAVDGAMITAAKILQAVRSGPFGEPGKPPVTLTVSIGIASYPVHGETFRSLIESADRALYGAKKEGRDRARTPDNPLQSLELIP
ncbi:MAG: GGDEF domain-containing protein, partial [Actinomycetota bacterium]